MIRVVHSGSGIRTLYPSRIPDPGVKKAPDPGSATLAAVFAPWSCCRTSRAAARECVSTRAQSPSPCVGSLSQAVDRLPPPCWHQQRSPMKRHSESGPLQDSEKVCHSVQIVWCAQKNPSVKVCRLSQGLYSVSTRTASTSTVHPRHEVAL
jgi:hypothetical protein